MELFKNILLSNYEDHTERINYKQDLHTIRSKIILANYDECKESLLISIHFLSQNFIHFFMLNCFILNYYSKICF